MNEGMENLKEIEDLEDKYQTVTDGLYVLQGSLNRIANALEEVLRLVKKDQEESKKIWDEPKVRENPESIQTK